MYCNRYDLQMHTNTAIAFGETLKPEASRVRACTYIGGLHWGSGWLAGNGG